MARHVSAIDRGLKPGPIWDLLAGALAVGLEVLDLLFDLGERLAAPFEPILTVDRYFLGFLAVAGEDVVNRVNKEARSSAGRVVDRVAQVGIDHLDHEGTNLTRSAELPIQPRLL